MNRRFRYRFPVFFVKPNEKRIVGAGYSDPRIMRNVLEKSLEVEDAVPYNPNERAAIIL